MCVCVLVHVCVHLLLGLSEKSMESEVAVVTMIAFNSAVGRMRGDEGGLTAVQQSNVRVVVRNNKTCHGGEGVLVY